MTIPGSNGPPTAAPARRLKILTAPAAITGPPAWRAHLREQLLKQLEKRIEEKLLVRPGKKRRSAGR